MPPACSPPPFPIRTTACPPRRKKLVQHLDSSLRSAEDLISDLLDISRLENGKINPDAKPFAVNELFDTLGAEFKALAQGPGGWSFASGAVRCASIAT